MSKAEEKAWEKYPYEEGYDIELEYPSTYDENKDQREAYIEGYHQAEKDNELTWEDIEKIDDITIRLDSSLELRGMSMSNQEFYQEVLKRFKDYKERKEE